MGQIADTKNPWRDLLRSEPASFRSVIFHVETGARLSGRRTVVHEYPKRSDQMGPYAEDMGRQARRFSISGYLVYKPGDVQPGSSVRYDYVSQRQRLYEALEKEDAGQLKHPVFAPGGMLVMCERFTMSESRERGGYTQFEMQFVEAGTAVNAAGASNATAAVTNQAAKAEVAAGALTDPNALTPAFSP